MMETGTENSNLQELYKESYFQGLPIRSNRIDNILRHITLMPTDNVCEFGCGVGHILIAISSSVQSCLGIDFSTYAINTGKKSIQNNNIENIELIDSDISELYRNLEFQSKFDKVLMMDVTEHICDDTLQRFLRSASHLLKVDGELFIHTPNADYYIERMKARNFLLKQLPGHIAVRNSKQYIEILDRSGFKVTSVRYLPHYHKLLNIFDKFFIRIPVINILFRSRLLISAEKTR